MIAVALMLSVLTPEVRRSAWRRSMAEVRTGGQVSRRVAKGEIMMHRVKDGPKWWGQEVWHGTLLSLEMLRQPGFVIMALYSAWIYAQVVLLIVLLGSLTSRYYRLRATFVGAAVSSIAIGALAAVPFQKANIFSRARHRPTISNARTIDRRLTWTSHLVRRAIFTITLPVAGVMYAIVSFGPPVHLVFPCLFAAMVGFLSCLAVSECNGILMETWDCSDLQTGMTGRSRSSKNRRKKTNYSSFPRVQAGFAIIHSLGFILAAGATSIGGMAQRSLGQRTATAVVAAILLVLTLLLLCVLARFKKVEIIPISRTMEMDKWTEARRNSVRQQASLLAAAKAAGRKDASKIHEKDIGAHAHLNRRALEIARDELSQRSQEVLDELHRGGVMMTNIVRKVSKRSMRDKYSETSSMEEDDAARNTPREVVRTPTGIVRNHSSKPGSPFVERERFVGQVLSEEEEARSADESSGSDTDVYSSQQDRAHASHVMPKVRPYHGFEHQNLEGKSTRSGSLIEGMASEHHP
ncbi:hypothetical protein SCUP515_06853 [Seiridium cupressi]